MNGCTKSAVNILFTLFTLNYLSHLIDRKGKLSHPLHGISANSFPFSVYADLIQCFSDLLHRVGPQNLILHLERRHGFPSPLIPRNAFGLADDVLNLKLGFERLFMPCVALGKGCLLLWGQPESLWVGFCVYLRLCPDLEEVKTS